MNEKELQLIQYLKRAQGWTTAATLAGQLEVSLRTVKNYVADLNDRYPNLISSSSSGYLIRQDAADGILSNRDRQSIPQTNKDRARYVVIRLLRAAGPLSLLDLCDELFVSLSTLRIVLKRVKNQLSHYHLELATNGDLVEVLGEEADHRKMLNAIIFNESSASFFDIDALQEIFDNIDTGYAVRTTQEILWENHYYVTDYSAYNIILHIVIAIDRNLYGAAPRSASGGIAGAQPPEDPPADGQPPQSGGDGALWPEFVPVDIRRMAQDLVSRLEDYYGVSFSRQDLLEFAMLFYTRASSLALQEVNEDNLERYLGREYTDLLGEMQRLLLDVYGISLNADSRVSFALHIKSLLIRMRSGNVNRNPLTVSVKTSCPIIYDVAVSLSSVITDRTGLVVSDDEIAYIAFHIGNTIEEQRAYESRISVILNCPTYYNMDHDLLNRLSERFRHDIVVTDVTVSEQQLSRYGNADLILTTVPLKYHSRIPCIQIQPFLTLADANIVERAISHIREEKKQQVFLSQLRKILLPDFYEHIDRPMNRLETIHYMCGRLHQAGFSTDGYEAAVVTREKLSSTAFTDFAIPHALKMEEKKSCLYILINDQPIKWDSADVRLVIMLCFSSADRSIFYSVFESLSFSLLNRWVISQILETDTTEEFIQIISRAQQT